MSGSWQRWLFWTPRLMSLAFIIFLSLFALDVFDGNLGFWETALALIMHLLPVIVLIVALILAWRWEWIGAAIYAVAGLLYVFLVVTRSHPDQPAMKVIWILTIAGPALVIAALFWANWLKHDELRKH